MNVVPDQCSGQPTGLTKHVAYCWESNVRHNFNFYRILIKFFLIGCSYLEIQIHKILQICHCMFLSVRLKKVDFQGGRELWNFISGKMGKISHWNKSNYYMVTNAILLFRIYRLAQGIKNKITTTE